MINTLSIIFITILLCSPKPSLPVEQLNHKVVKGDTLHHLAEKYFDNPQLRKKIYNANKKVINNPDLIFSGQTSIIPAFEKKEQKPKLKNEGKVIEILPTGQPQQPIKKCKSIIIENKFGGMIKAVYVDGTEEYIGYVLKMVLGVKKWLWDEKTMSPDPETISISTDPKLPSRVVPEHLLTNGFKIITTKRANTAELKTVHGHVFYMVISSLDARDKTLGKLQLLFDSVKEKIDSSSGIKVMGKKKDKYYTLPELTGHQPLALESITEFKLVFEDKE